METKHTPLPWKFEDDRVRDANGISIVDPFWMESPTVIHGEMKANAEFIVRAANCHNDLLAACKAMRDAGNDLTDCRANGTPEQRMAFRYALVDADAALKKAGAECYY